MYNMQQKQGLPGLPQANPQQYPSHNYPVAQNYQMGGSLAHPNAALIQPPALNAEQPPEGNEQYYMGKPPMTISNNQHSEFEGYQPTDEEGMWGANEAHIASMFWQQRCGTLLDRFEWFYQRFEILRNEYISLSEEMQRMDSEEEWHRFQQHHDQFHQKIQEMEQELSAVLAENQQLMQQRRSGDSESVWQQRYNQLLGNFKSLEATGGVPVDQYRTLQQHYNQLEYQYGQAMNQIQRMQQESPQAELQNYKNKINTLHNENVQLQNMLADLEQQNQHLKQSQVQQSQLQELLRKVEEKEEIIEQLQQEFRNRPHPQQVESIIEEKEKEIAEYQEMLAARERDLMSMQEHINSQQLNAVDPHIEEELQRYHQKVNHLQSEVKAHEEEVRKMQKQLQVEQQQKNSIEKKLNTANKQVNTLNEVLKNKNDELLSLKGNNYELQKLRQVQDEMMRTAEQRDRLAERYRRQGQDIDKLQTQIERLTKQITQNNNARKQFNVRSMREEIEDLNQEVQHGQAELERTRTTIRLKEEYIDKILEELQQSKQQLGNLQAMLEQERQNARQKEIKYNSKANQHQNRIKDLDYAFNMQLKETLEKEVRDLRKENRTQQEELRQQEEKELMLSTQLAVLQKQQKNHDKELTLMKAKEKELENVAQGHKQRYQQIDQKYTLSIEELKQFQQTQNRNRNNQNELQAKIQQLKRIIERKNSVVQELQSQLDHALVKAQKCDRICQQNAQLKAQLSVMEKEQVLKASRGMLSPTHSQKEIIRQQNNGAIQRLGQQNQRLKEELGDVLKTLGNITYSQQPPLKLQQRLDQFNQRLQMTIRGGGQNLIKSDSQKKFILWEREKAQLVEHYENEMKKLKQQLDRSRLGGSQASSNKLVGSGVGWINNLQSQRLKDQISFLRERNSEQEERNGQLIRVNEELKNKIDSILKVRQGNAALEYYKEQCQRFENDNQTLKSKIKHLGEQCRGYKLELAGKNTKISQDYEFKMLQLELKVQEQQRKIIYLQSEKATNDQYTPAGYSKKDYTPAEPKRQITFSRKIEENSKVESRVQASATKYTPMQQEFYSVVGNIGATGVMQTNSKSIYKNLQGDKL